MSQQENTILPFLNLSHKSIILDASALIEMMDDQYFLDVVSRYKLNGCGLMTLPEVYLEVVHGLAPDRKQIEEFDNMLEALEIKKVDLPQKGKDGKTDKSFEKRKDFVVRYFSCAKQASIVDYKICMSAFLFPELYILSGNVRDIPSNLFDKVGAITIDKKNGVHAEVLFRFNEQRFNKMRI